MIVIWNLGPGSEELYSHLQAHLLRFCLTSTRYDTVECTSLVQRKYLCSVLLKYAQIRSDTPHSVQTKWLFTKAVACFQLSSQQDRPGRLPARPALDSHGCIMEPSNKTIYMSFSTWLCLKKKGVPWCPGIPPMIGNRNWENDDGCALFSDKPTWLARFARASASPSNLQGPACFTALRTLALPAFIMWTDDGYAKRNLQYPNIMAI